VIDQQGFSLGLQRLQRQLHRLTGSAHDAYPVDFMGRHDPDAPGESVPLDTWHELLAASRCELFGVTDACEPRAQSGFSAREDHGGGYDWAGPSPPAGLVQTGHSTKALRPEALLKVQSRRDAPLRQSWGLALFLQAGRFPLALAQVVELGTADVAVAQDFDLLDARRVRGERPLHAHAVSRNTPHSELGVGSLSSADADNRAPNELDALSVAFHDPEVDLHIVPHAEMRAIGLEPDILLSLLFFD
jgi:hypothetical protein